MSADTRAKMHQVGPLRLYALSVAIGIVAAAGAVAFRGLIALFHNLFFLGTWSFLYDANVHTPPGPRALLSYWRLFLAPSVSPSWSADSLPKPKGMGCQRS